MICHDCKHQAKAGNNTIHSKCCHPIIDNILSDHDALKIIFDNFSKENKVTSGLWGLYIDVEESAIPNGWCYWPFNFDPRWVNKCTGYNGVK